MSGLWFDEEENRALRYGYALDKVLYHEFSDFQEIGVYQTTAYGKMLTLDRCVMLTEGDEFVYHEMISHIPVGFHADPRHILIIGGGDGGTVRELLKYPSIESIIVCEIDQMVIDVSKQFFPQVSSGLGEQRVSIHVEDGMDFIGKDERLFDLIIIDSTDPVGPGESLFTKEFYNNISKSLKKSGIIVSQTSSIWGKKETLQATFRNMGSVFKYLKPYVAGIPTYPRATWSWTLGAHELFELDHWNEQRFSTIVDSLRYLDLDMVRASFCLPKFYREKLGI